MSQPDPTAAAPRASARSGTPGQITLEEITTRTDPHPENPAHRAAVGGKILLWVVPFVGAAFLLFAAYSAWSYPRLADFTALTPTPCVPSGPPGQASADPAQTSPRAVPAQAGCPAGAAPERIPGPQAALLFAEAKAAWLTQTKDLGQLFIITPILPLLGTVIGYMVGRREGE